MCFPENMNLPKARPESFRVHALGAIRADRERHLVVQPRVGRAVKVNAPRHFLASMGSWQGNSDKRPDRVVRDRDFRVKETRPSKTFDALLKADLVLVIVLSDKVHILAHGPGDE